MNQVRNPLNRRIAIVPVFLVLCVHVSCRGQQTEDPASNVVKLRNDLRRLACGEIDQLEGRTQPEQFYVLLFGYQGPVESLPVPESLHQELEYLTPRDYERYVLVEVVSGRIRQYTKWEAGNDPQFSPVPIVIRGDPFKMSVEQREPYRVNIRVE